MVLLAIKTFGLSDLKGLVLAKYEAFLRSLGLKEF